MRAAGGQIQGARKRQEDAWHVERYGDDEILALLADGLGGHPAGDVASREAVKNFTEQFTTRRGRSTATPRQWIQDSTLGADAHVRELARRKPLYKGMATTLVALYLKGGQFWAASVGDSYLLLLRQNKLMRLNELHSEGGGVTSCVGYNLARVDIADALPVAAGDRFLLASDGVIVLDDDEVSRFLNSPDGAETAVNDILSAIEAADSPGQDNATVIAVVA